METKQSDNNEKISISEDSDCEIQEVDIQSITVVESPNSTVATVINLDDDDNVENDDPNISAEVLATENTENDISEDNKNSFIFEVNFRNEELFKEYKDLVLESFRGTFNGKGFLLVEDDSKIQVFRDECSFAIMDETADDKPSATAEEEDMNIANLFMIDTEPAEKVDFRKIPSYKRTIKEILDEGSAEKKKKNEDDCERPVQKKSCFNCDGTDHDLRTCPKPRNNAKINKAKKSMISRKERYHVDIEQRFSHLRPGKVSKQLREALGIGSGELPFFFYRMRVLGYPPGWLEDARVAHSGITLFDSEGRSVRDPEEEEGEVDSDKNKYDVNKIVSFPGFNTNPGKNFYDDFKHHNVPPLNKDDCREKFIEMLGDNIVKGYKRKKLKSLPDGDTTPIEEKSLEVYEMEIENEENTSLASVEFTRPPPPPTPPKDADAEVPPPPPPASPPPESPKKSSSSKRSPSPTLEDLEEKQKLLREMLQSSTITISDNDDSLIDDVLELEANNSSRISIKSSTPNKSHLSIKLPDETADNTNSSIVSNGEVDSQECSTPQTPLASAIESVPGTPLLKFSPFDKLPSGENFKVGVSDVINFENLPDSVGTYEKMKGVIKKVRTIVTKLQSEDA